MPHSRYLRIPLLWSLKLSEIMSALSLLQHSLENTSRQIMGLILLVSFFLGLQSYVAHYPISESIRLIHFLSFLYVYRKGTCESKDSKVRIFLFYWEPLWSRCLGVHVYTCVSIHTHTNQIHTHTFMCDKVCPSVIVRWWNKVSLPSSTLVQRWNSH